VETKLDISGMKDGDVAGVAAYNRGFPYVAVKRVDGVNTVGVVNRVQPFAASIDQDAIESLIPGSTADLGSASEVHLKADLDFASPTGQLWTTFYYSFDGLAWNKLGDRVGPQTLDGTLSHFMGHRVGLFHYATLEAGGHVDFDHFLLSDTLTSQGLALDTSDLDAAIAVAGTLEAGDYPAAEWAELEKVLADAVAARATTLGTQNQIDAPERALSLQIARLAVIGDGSEETSDVSAAVTTRCVAGKEVLVTTLTNEADATVTATVETAYGSKSNVELAAGASASQSFTTRQVSIPSGEVTVKPDDGEAVTVQYAAASCG
jgi:hypothetical protein